MRWIKLDITSICFEDFINQLNLFYICIYLCLQQNKSYETRELGRGPKNFARASLHSEQWVKYLYHSMFLILVLFSLCTYDLCLFGATKGPIIIL
jgi:hypothetical protein